MVGRTTLKPRVPYVWLFYLCVLELTLLASKLSLALHFRPTSLVGGLYKLLAKVLANRLKRVVGNLVSDFQHVFVGIRQILDAILIANKVIDSRLKGNMRGIICKLGNWKGLWPCRLEFCSCTFGKHGFWIQVDFGSPHRKEGGKSKKNEVRKRRGGWWILILEQ